jgi:hypothetical protein
VSAKGKWRKGRSAKGRAELSAPQTNKPVNQEQRAVSPEQQPKSSASASAESNAPPTGSPPASGKSKIDALYEKATSRPLLALWLTIIGAVVGGILTIWNLDKRIDVLKAGIDATVSEKVSGALIDFAKRTQEIEKQNEMLRVAYERQSEMSAAMCRGDYEAVLTAYDELRHRYPMSTLPEITRNGVYEVVVKALVDRDDYSSIRQDEIEEMARSLDTWHSRSLCFSTDYYLGICFMAVGKPEDARKRLFHSAEAAKRRGNALNRLETTYAPLLLTCLLDPKNATVEAKVAAAMALLDECEALVPVAYAKIASILITWEPSSFAQHLRRNNGEGFSQSYKKLSGDIYKNQERMKEVNENGSLFLKGTVLMNGVPTPINVYVGAAGYQPVGAFIPAQPETIVPPKREGTTEPPNSIPPPKKEPGASAPLPSRVPNLSEWNQDSLP